MQLRALPDDLRHEPTALRRLHVVAMARIEVTPTSLVVRMEGADRFLAAICGLCGGVKGRLQVPLEHVAGVDVPAPEAQRLWKGCTVLALSLHRVVTRGRILDGGEWAFWDVHDHDKAIRIALHDEPYAKLVIEVDDPARVTAEISQAVSRRVAGDGA